MLELTVFRNKLDDLKTYRALDTKNVYENILKAPKQFELSWHSGKFLNLLFDPEKIKNVFFCGTDYAAQVGKILKSLSPVLFDVPFETVQSYRLPKYASKSSLAIVASFTGNDQESISCYQEALSKKSSIIVIASGGKLRELAVENHTPLILTEEKAINPGTASTNIFSILGASLGIFTRLSPSSNQYFKEVTLVQSLEKSVEIYRREIDTENNPAKSLSQKYKGLGVLLFGSAHLSGVCELGVYYLSHLSKVYSHTVLLPESSEILNNPFPRPTELKNQIQLFVLNSSMYPKPIQEQVENAKVSLLKQKYRLTILKPDSQDISTQVLESLVFLVYFSYYLSIVNQINPS